MLKLHHFQLLQIWEDSQFCRNAYYRKDMLKDHSDCNTAK